MRGLKLNLILIVFTLCCICTASAQWVQQTNPTGTFLQDGSFINNNTGWVCGNGIAKTTDGGNNWINLPNPESHSIISIHFINANTGFLGSFDFWKTTNGGNNWTKVVPDAGNYCDMSFINSSTGWVVSNSNGIWRTTDGGNIWTMINNQHNHTINAIDFIDANTGWACGFDGAMLKTTNGGINWTAQISGTVEDLYSIDFSDANTGRAAGLSASYTRTSNGGTNWASVPGPFSFRYDKVFFISPFIGWLTGASGIALTTNNGTTWIDQSPSGGSGNFSAISYISPNTVFIGGFEIYKSISGGFNLPAPTNLTLTPVSTSQINLSWTDNTTNEDKFMIERSPNGSSWTLIDSVNAGVTSYQATGLTTNTEYHFRVCAKKIIFTGEYSNAPFDWALMVSPTHLSPSNNFVSTSFTPTLSWSSVSGGAIYFLQVASDSNFSNIVYSNSAILYNSQVIPAGILQNSTKYYWRTKVQNFSNESAYSGFWSFTIQDPNYGHNMQTGNNLYYFANSTPAANLSPSKPAYNWRDTTGSTYMIRNGAVVRAMIAGNLDDGLFRFTNILTGDNAIRFFGNNYQTLYIGTNGIISFGSFDPQLGVNIEPPLGGLTNNNMLNAILPLWKDLSFGDGDVTSGKSLCIKVTSNEIIITFSRVPSYNPAADANDYVSFQAIIQYTATPTQNSKIDFMYNYNETGSSFITKYNNNTIYPMLTGIKGASGSAQEFQYRFFNSSLQLISSGPIFGSNLALAFSPDNTLLPVELSSFTSQINGSNVKLEWSTVNEQNNSGFEIQRTNANENNWKKISFIQGNGTTNESKNYSYEDRNISSGKYQYRLKQIDFNGNYEYHALANEVEIGAPKKFALSQNYPNPFNPYTKINYELPITNYVSIKIYDVNGKEVAQLINQNQKAGYYTVEFNASNLASGMYFYRIQAGEFSATKKMILIK
jgi:photosystem II stability/assembly factor-like uncharacterized protein